MFDEERVHHHEIELELPPFSSLLDKESSASSSSSSYVRVEAIAKSSDALQAHYVWQSSVTMSERIASRNENFIVFKRGSSVIELGAGAALPSLVCAKLAKTLGLDLVMATDYPSEELLKGIANNFRANNVDFTRLERIPLVNDDDELTGVAIAPLKWTNEGEDARRYDYAIMADTLWLPHLHDELISTLRRVLKPRTGIVYAAYLNHDADGDVSLKFLDKIQSRGFRVLDSIECEWRKKKKNEEVGEGDYGLVYVRKLAYDG